jgi:phenylacetate-CoA ligase
VTAVTVESPTRGTAEALLLSEFRRAADTMPAYRILLDEQGSGAAQVVDQDSFTTICPLLSKKNTFDRFTLNQLSAGGELSDVADVLTSSGHGGRFSFGVISRSEASASALFIDLAFEQAFGISFRKTLAINCLPMGVIFSSHMMTVATTSVREDMAVALVEAFGDRYEQIVLVGDPLFMKRFTDYAAGRGIDWHRYRVNVILGEEVFGEHFRTYLAAWMGLNIDRPEDGYIMSSFGVGELGLHLCYETPATIGLRRASAVKPDFARDLLGVRRNDGAPLPMIFTFNPLRTFVEVVDPDADGYGALTISMLDPARSIPLLRYQTGDIVRLLDHAQVAELVRSHGVELPAGLPPTLLALRGRHTEMLPNGSHVALYKDALYAHHSNARRLTGAFRVTFTGETATMHVQLEPAQAPTTSLEQGILQAIPAHLRPDRLVLWLYHEFPFGMKLDYERKFTYYVAGEARDDSDTIG